jgi:uncharacterized protein YodC (DUF2158 family)
MGFRIGDTVQLKSGGPIMTVRKKYYWDNKIECNWFQYGTLQEGLFDPDQLMRVPAQMKRPGNKDERIEN